MPWPKETQRIVGKRLKDNQTETEAILWRHLRDRRLEGMKFRRQRRIECFWPDFCCDELKIIFEIDGGVHDNEEQRSRDIERQKYLEANGFLAVRIRNEEVTEDLRSVLSTMRDAVSRRKQEFAH